MKLEDRLNSSLNKPYLIASDFASRTPFNCSVPGVVRCKIYKVFMPSPS